jgi:hypothetical protein
LLIALVPGHALAWQEFHQTGDDVQVELDADGKASFHHKLRWHVVRGPLKSIDLLNVDPSAEIDGDVPITAEDGRSFTAHAAWVEERADKPADGAHPTTRPVRIVVDQPRALMRGTFTFALALRVDMVRSGAISRDGSMWRMGWSAPVAEDGFDGARTLLMTPAAPEPPKPIVADTGTVDDSVVSVLHRDPAQDSLELVRPHVARGEAVSWTVRLDPRAFPRIADPRLRPLVRAAAAPEPDRLRESAVVGGLCALGLLYAWMLRYRSRALVVAATAGFAVAGGVGLQLLGEPVFGAACIAVAVLVASIRPGGVKPPPRGPGRWLAISPAEAFGEGGAEANPVVAAAAVVLGFAGVVMLLRTHPDAPWVVALDGSVLLPLFLGGRPALVPRQTRAAARWLGRAFRRLEIEPLRVSPWARMGADSFDELRLLVLPRVAMPGVLGLEIGLGWGSTPVGLSASPEVLARVLEESPAAARLAVELPQLRAVPGRRPEERVVRMMPRVPTHAGTVALVRALAETLTDRRAAAPPRPFTAPDRRRVYAPATGPAGAEAVA